jgi:5-methylcytosine-specific restriction endonuclease McrA
MSPFHHLKDYLQHRMRMSHVYQPVMIQALLEGGGERHERDIARALMSFDVAQLEYYEERTRNMVGAVLRRNGIVRRDRRTRVYTLIGADGLSEAEQSALIALCREKLDGFIRDRGDKPWHHRRKSDGYIPGTIRYEVLKAARFRCELCGISAEEKALEVDHIVPRIKGGPDDLSNLQALCYSCNAMKRDRDDADFRAVRESYSKYDAACVFCVTGDHALIIPRRHVASILDLGRPEYNACLELLGMARTRIAQLDASAAGYNVGFNDGTVAGQTVMHAHIHVIPRRAGDVADPTGGVRNVIPGMGRY